MYLSATLGLALLVVVLIVKRLTRSRRSRLPPGPKGVPILGNIFDMPKGHEWLTYMKWSREYGKLNVPSVQATNSCASQTLIYSTSISLEHLSSSSIRPKTLSSYSKSVPHCTQIGTKFHAEGNRRPLNTRSTGQRLSCSMNCEWNPSFISSISAMTLVL